MATNVTYRIIPPTGGLIQLGLVNGRDCRSGVFTVSTCDTNVSFGTSELQPRGLPLGTEKCILILNTHETVLQFNLNFTPDDVVTVYNGLFEITSVTGKQNVTIGKLDLLSPLLIVIKISEEILARRSLGVRIETPNCSVIPRFLFLGPYDPGYPVLRTMGDPIVEKDHFEPAYVFGTLGVAVFFGIVMTVSCVRYQWFEAVTAVCKREKPPSPTGTSFSASSRSVQKLNLLGMRM
jgi:hypothetical protein